MKTLIISLAVIVLALLTVALKSPIFLVRNETYKINQADCVSIDDLKKFTDVSGSNIFLVNGDDAGKRLETKYPCIGQVVLQRKLPSSLSIVVSGRQPKLVLIPYTLEATPSTASSFIEQVDPRAIDATKLNDKFLVDDQNQVYARGDALGVPNIVILNQELTPGKNLGAGVVSNILTILQKVKDLSLRADWVFLSNNSLLIEDQNPSKIYFSLDSDISGELASLQLILQKSTIDSKLMDSLDLRFDKPVVIYSAKK